MLVVPNKEVPHLDWFAKYTTASFNMALYYLLKTLNTLVFSHKIHYLRTIFKWKVIV